MKSSAEKIVKNSVVVDRPLISVIMNGHNAARYLSEAIDSVINQTYSNWEIILWDNASTDATESIVSSYLDPRIKYFRSTDFCQLGEARNKAIKKSSGEFVAFLDCDDLWLPQKLEMQIIEFNDPLVGIVICDTIYFDERGDYNQLYAKLKPPTGQVFHELLGNYYLSLETVIVRRSALDALSEWFDIRFNMVEEADLFIRLSRCWKLAYVDRVLAKWRTHINSWSFDKFQNFPIERELMLIKYGELFPNFYIQYSREVRLIKRTIAREKALSLWRIGLSSAARSQITEFKLTSHKDAIFYFVTFIPFRLIRSYVPRRFAPR